MGSLKDQKINDEKLKAVSGGIIHHGVNLTCPTCGEDKLQGRDVPDSEGGWVVTWFCPRCKQIVLTTPR